MSCKIQSCSLTIRRTPPSLSFRLPSLFLERKNTPVPFLSWISHLMLSEKLPQKTNIIRRKLLTFKTRKPSNQCLVLSLRTERSQTTDGQFPVSLCFQSHQDFGMVSDDPSTLYEIFFYCYQRTYVKREVTLCPYTQEIFFIVLPVFFVFSTNPPILLSHLLLHVAENPTVDKISVGDSQGLY